MRVSTIATLTLLALFTAASARSDDAAVDEDPFDFSAAPHSSPPRTWIDADSVATEQVISLLDSRLTGPGFDFKKAPLEEVVELLREQYPVPIHLDLRGLDDLGLSSDEPVAISVKNIKLGAALQLMLEPLELGYHVADGVLIITSKYTTSARLPTAIYDVDDLITSPADYRRLVDVIFTTVAYDSWSENGGGQADLRCFPQRGALVVRQTTVAHEQIKKLLDGLRLQERKEVVEPHLSGGSGGVDLGGGGGGVIGVGRGGDGRGLSLGSARSGE